MKHQLPKRYPFSPIKEIRELQEHLFKKETVILKVEDAVEIETETFSTPKSCFSNCEAGSEQIHIPPIELPPCKLLLDELHSEIEENNEIIRKQSELIEAQKKELKELDDAIKERIATIEYYGPTADYYTQMYHNNEIAIKQQMERFDYVVSQVTHYTQLLDSFSFLSQNPEHFSNLMISHLINKLTSSNI